MRTFLEDKSIMCSGLNELHCPAPSCKEMVIPKLLGVFDQLFADNIRHQFNEYVAFMKLKEQKSQVKRKEQPQANRAYDKKKQESGLFTFSELPTALSNRKEKEAQQIRPSNKKPTLEESKQGWKTANSESSKYHPSKELSTLLNDKKKELRHLECPKCHASFTAPHVCQSLSHDSLEIL